MSQASNEHPAIEEIAIAISNLIKSAKGAWDNEEMACKIAISSVKELKFKTLCEILESSTDEKLVDIKNYVEKKMQDYIILKVSKEYLDDPEKDVDSLRTLYGKKQTISGSSKKESATIASLPKKANDVNTERVSKPTFASIASTQAEPDQVKEHAVSEERKVNDKPKQSAFLDKVRRGDTENTLYGYSPLDDIPIISEEELYIKQEEENKFIRTSLRIFLREKDRGPADMDDNLRQLIRDDNDVVYPAGTSEIPIEGELCYTFSEQEVPNHVFYHWKESNCWLVARRQKNGTYAVVPYNVFCKEIRKKGGALQFTK
jgi:hypothetical protein